MKVGFVSPYSFSHSGGVQNHIFGLASWLKTQGHQVTIVGPDEASEEMLEEYRLDAAEVSTCGASIPVPVNGSMARINFGRKQRRLVKAWLASEKPDVLHIHEPLAPSVALIALSVFDGPIVGTFHSARRVFKWLRMLIKMKKHLVSKLNRTIAVSRVAHGVASFLYELDPVIIGNGLDLSQHEVKLCSARWRGGSCPQVLFVGRYDEPRKGFEVFRRSVGVVRTVHPDVRIVIAGRGTPRLDPGLEFVGFVSDQQRNELLSNSDVYVAPNTGQESFGIVLIEALASGTPVVASDIAAFADVLRGPDGMVGRLFKNGDSSDLAKQIIESLAEDRDIWLESGRRRAEMFDWSQVGPQVLEQYQQAIADYAEQQEHGSRRHGKKQL